MIDDLRAAADVAAELRTWLHVDGAYGGAALAAPSVRDRFAGIEAADSFIVDPHKWLFAPFDSCALLYREPEIARQAHTQHAEYLDVLHAEDGDTVEWNASDYAHHLSRRARGLPLWFSLATHGTQAYTRRRRDDVARRPPGRRPRARRAPPRAAPRTRAVGRAVPPDRLGPGPLHGMERLATGDPAVVRDPDGLGLGDGAAMVHRQSR